MSDLLIYDGQVAVAALRDAGTGEVTAFRVDAAGRKKRIGKYSTRAIALRAISEAVPPLASAAFDPRVEPPAGPHDPAG